MHARSLPFVVMLFAALALPVSACRKGGGAPPCRDRSSSVLRTADGTVAGALTAVVGIDGLTLAYRPADGRPYDGAYLIASADGEFRLFPDSADGVLVIPWDGIADDVCGQTLTLSVESLPTEVVSLVVTCPSGAKTANATDTGGGGGGGGYCQP